MAPLARQMPQVRFPFGFSEFTTALLSLPFQLYPSPRSHARVSLTILNCLHASSAHALEIPISLQMLCVSLECPFLPCAPKCFLSSCLIKHPAPEDPTRVGRGADLFLSASPLTAVEFRTTKLSRLQGVYLIDAFELWCWRRLLKVP